MKKALKIILLVVCSLIANILVNTVIIVAWVFTSAAGVLLGILLGIAAAAAVCALGVTVCEKVRIRRHTLLICVQAPALAIAAFLVVSGLIEYRRIVSADNSDMWSGMLYGLNVAVFQASIFIFVTVLLVTAALALTLFIKRKRGNP